LSVSHNDKQIKDFITSTPIRGFMKTSMLTVGHEYQFYSTPRSTKFYEYATN